MREKYPEMLLCVASNGLNTAPYAEELARLQVSHVTITVNTIDPIIGGKDLLMGARPQERSIVARKALVCC